MIICRPANLETETFVKQHKQGLEQPCKTTKGFQKNLRRTQNKRHFKAVLRDCLIMHFDRFASFIRKFKFIVGHSFIWLEGHFLHIKFVSRAKR